MAFDEGLAQRIRENLGELPGLVEKKMFGGIGFILDGNMACGVHKESLIVRIAPDTHDESVARPFVRVFDITGRPMKGWILVDQDGVSEEADLAHWVQQGVDFARTLPKK